MDQDVTMLHMRPKASTQVFADHSYLVSASTPRAIFFTAVSAATGISPVKSLLVLPFAYPILSASVLRVLQKRLNRVGNVTG